MKSKQVGVTVMFLTLLAIGTLALAACARTGTAQGSSGGGPAPTASGTGGSASSCASGTVHTLASSFQESCVDVAKGASLQVVPVVQSFHILTNGTWVNNTPQPAKEQGAPTVNDVQVTTATVTIGPFTVAGTFHLYCTVHPGMKLTVIVR
jgi:plastocyanin